MAWAWVAIVAVIVLVILVGAAMLKLSQRQPVREKTNRPHNGQQSASGSQYVTSSLVPSMPGSPGSTAQAQVSKQLALATEQLKVSRENYDKAVEIYREMRERARAQFLTADSDAYQADRRLDELERFTTRTLEYHAATGAKPLILRAGLYVQQLPVLDIVLELVDKFLVAIGADLMYRQEDGPDGSKFYLRWPLDKAPRELLDSLTRAAHRSSNGDTASATDGNTATATPTDGNTATDADGTQSDGNGNIATATDGNSATTAASATAAISYSSTSNCGGSEPLAGTAELREVLDALRDGGLGVLYLGPLILLRTKTCIQTGFLKPGFQCLTEPQKRDAVNDADPNLMAQLQVAVFLEFRL